MKQYTNQQLQAELARRKREKMKSELAHAKELGADLVCTAPAALAEGLKFIGEAASALRQLGHQFRKGSNG